MCTAMKLTIRPFSTEFDILYTNGNFYIWFRLVLMLNMPLKNKVTIARKNSKWKKRWNAFTFGHFYSHPSADTMNEYCRLYTQLLALRFVMKCCAVYFFEIDIVVGQTLTTLKHSDVSNLETFPSRDEYTMPLNYTLI